MPKGHASDRGLSSLRVTAKENSRRARSPCPFPPPWTIDEANDACFIVCDKNGQALGYFYLEEEPGPTHGREPADQGRGAAHGCTTARIAFEVAHCLTFSGHFVRGGYHSES
jgi:hypothetical protein